jgi:hypothetical protein
MEFSRELSHGAWTSGGEEQGAGDLESDFAGEQVDRAGDVGCCRDCGVDEYPWAGKMQVTSEIEPAPALLTEYFAGGCHDPISDEQMSRGSLKTRVRTSMKLVRQ